MIKKSIITSFFCMICTLTFLGDAPRNTIIVLTPVQTDSTSYEQGRIFIVSVLNELGKELLVSTQWEIEKLLDISTKEQKDNFPKEFYKLFPAKSALQLLATSYKFYAGWSKPDTLKFNYTDTTSIRSFWQTPTFVNLIKQIQSSNASSILLYVKGWKDTVYRTEYDDPTDGERSLFKLQLQLVSGENLIYFSPVQQKQNAIEYFTKFVSEAKSVDARENRFHNSKLEENCKVCHEGLPSGEEGKSMKAECGTCHKSIVSNTYTHGPAAEPKDCILCHEWSQEKNAVVAAKGVPDVCYDCHSEKKEEVENSKVPHAIAADCATCHSPHSSTQQTLLKKNVHELCLSCHDTYKINHPVDRHPMRFAKLTHGNTKEISCVSCHKPHGSEDKSLLTAGGGSMAVCMQCHQK